MNPTPVSFWEAKRAALAWHRAGVIDLDSIVYLIAMASHASAPFRKAARRVVSECGCGHMVGERRGAVGAVAMEGTE